MLVDKVCNYLAGRKISYTKNGGQVEVMGVDGNLLIYPIGGDIKADDVIKAIKVQVDNGNIEAQE